MQDISQYKNDLSLAAACAKGDQRAQRILFERVKSPMFGVCLRFAANRGAAEDLLQEGLIRVFRDIDHYRGEGSLDGWVRRVFVRTAIEDYRRREKLPKTIEIAQLEEVFFEQDQPFEQDDPESAIALLQKLPPGFRAVLNLAVLEDKSHEEIARDLGITASTSRSQLTRAKAFLKKIIQNTMILI
jgi:RNA polymerase sigma factor (sigma-70 family)